VEEWHFPRKPQVNVLRIATTDHAATEQTTSGSLGDISWVQKTPHRRNAPLLHTSTQWPGKSLHVISFTRPSPALAQQVTNAGVRRSGYEVNRPVCWRLQDKPQELVAGHLNFLYQLHLDAKLNTGHFSNWNFS